MVKIDEFKYLRLTTQSNKECGREVKKSVVEARWRWGRRYTAGLCGRQGKLTKR